MADAWTFQDWVDVIALASRRVIVEDMLVTVEVGRDPATPRRWVARPVRELDGDDEWPPWGWERGADLLLLAMVMSDGSEHRCQVWAGQPVLTGAADPSVWERWRS